MSLLMKLWLIPWYSFSTQRITEHLLPPVSQRTDL